MIITKKCKNCGYETTVDNPSIKICPKCKQETLIRIFKNPENISSVEGRDDHFIIIDRMMLNSPTPSGKTKTYI
jgi:hypothetical protein